MSKRTKGKIGYLAAKIDMAKAYDRVEWHFLEGVMRKMGFDERWIRIVMLCVTTVSYSVLVNGHKSETFAPGRGIRQGDPLSPYLFLLCAEGLSAYTSQAIQQGRLHGFKPAQGAPVISHLFFADDSIFFTRATVPASLMLKGILRDYEKESGQQVSFQKSDVSFSKNVSHHRRLEIGGILGMKVVEKHNKYLGLGTVAGRSKKELFGDIVERIKKKLKGWKEKTLSVAAREVLIRSVAEAQLNYAMSVFRVPEGVIDEVQSLITRFWWGQRGEERKAHWINRDRLVMPKEMGGMGLRELRGLNTAFLAKQLWGLLNQPESLIARILRAKYHKNDSILNAELGYRPSFV
ncbi:unnamed protein product [Linum trigynum]|uniref:Reverse transcriptase domain-containing protein n=1 Tax=Linum trigynum TaxID=586398 RepID=A0AAV2EW71_9ROSI